MGKRGPKPKKIIDTTWRPNLAYAIGLLTTDGCLGKDGLWIDLTSKDIEQLKNFSKCVGCNFKISKKVSGDGKISSRIQFKNKIFYDFLLSVGLIPMKSKIIHKLHVPQKYFFDFLRGCFDGDGCFYSYYDPRWRSSHMFYLEFTSASYKHISWLQEEIKKQINVDGHISGRKQKKFFQLKYAKKEALAILKKIYYTSKVVCLTRKKLKIKEALKVERKQQKVYARVLKLVDISA